MNKMVNLTLILGLILILKIDNSFEQDKGMNTGPSTVLRPTNISFKEDYTCEFENKPVTISSSGSYPGNRSCNLILMAPLNFTYSVKINNKPIAFGDNTKNVILEYDEGNLIYVAEADLLKGYCRGGKLFLYQLFRNKCKNACQSEPGILELTSYKAKLRILGGKCNGLKCYGQVTYGYTPGIQDFRLLGK